MVLSNSIIEIENKKMVNLDRESSFPLDISTDRKRKTADIVNKEVMEGNFTQNFYIVLWTSS